jgi:hypothetical protein
VPALSDSDLRRDMWVRLIVLEFKVGTLEAEDVFDL